MFYDPNKEKDTEDKGGVVGGGGHGGKRVIKWRIGGGQIWGDRGHGWYKWWRQGERVKWKMNEDMKNFFIEH